MIDIKYIREDKEKVKENIRKKFQDEKLEIVDEIEKLDKDLWRRQANIKLKCLMNLIIITSLLLLYYTKTDILFFPQKKLI